LKTFNVDPALHLPKANEFLPERLEVIKHTSTTSIHPLIFKDSPLLRLWYKKDDSFWVPKGNVWVQIKSPLAYVSPYNSVLAKLLCDLVIDDLTETSYYAQCAGLNFGLEGSVDGLTVQVSGYNDKLPHLLETILERLVTFTVKQDRFDVIKQQVKRELKNFDKESPYYHAMYFLNEALQEKLWNYEEKLRLLQGMFLWELFMHKEQSSLTQVYLRNRYQSRERPAFPIFRF
jgi:insulysin